MDPLSFTASLMTVSGVTIMTSKLVFKLCEKVKDAPKDVGDLLEQLQTFQGLLDELRTQVQESPDNTATQSKLLQIWGQSVAHMQRDVTNLHIKLSKLEQQLKKQSLGSRILLSARQMLSEKKIAEYQNKIYGHCGVLTCIKESLCDQKLSGLKQNTIQIGNENKEGFQRISSQVSQVTDHLEAQARDGFSDISSDLKSAKSASDRMLRDLQSSIDDDIERNDLVRQTVDEVRGEQVRTIEMTNLGFQAVQSALVTAVSSNREEHDSTHTMLRRQETLMQRLGNHLAFGNSKTGVRSSRTRSDTWGPITPRTTFYWRTRYHSLPLGILRISVCQARKYNGAENSASPESTESNIEVTFVPPKWLTCLALDYRMKLGYNSIEDQWHWGVNMRPLTVNQNPFVINALKSFDLGAIQKSFRDGLIRPTDYVLNNWGHIREWYRIPFVAAMTKDRTAWPSLLVYMAENGFPGQDVVLLRVSEKLHLERSPTFAEDILKHYIWIYLQHGGNLFTRSFFGLVPATNLLLPFGPDTAGLISESLFHSSEAWTVDELSSSGICFLGAVAQTDPKFRTRLKACLASYRSPLPATSTLYANNLFESTFGTASVLSHFHQLYEGDRWALLCGICRTGTPLMLRPFIDTGIDINHGPERLNMLGHAAAVGNLDIVCMLIEIGANGALALFVFIRHGGHLSDGLYKQLLELLVEKSSPTSFQELWNDSLLVVMGSSKALLSHPKAPEILFCQKVFSDELIISCEQYNACNYMCAAIRNRLGSVVGLLLQNAAYTNTKSSWLMHSVKCGAASCTEVLIRHGADVSFVDESGRSALELARSNVASRHPRFFTPTHCRYYHHDIRVKAVEDAETLAAVERALELKSHTTESSEMCGPSCGLESQTLNQEDQTTPVPQNILQKALRFLSTYYTPGLDQRRVEPYHLGIGDIWSLPFYEALCMRFFYVLSYVLLLAVGIIAVIQGKKRVPRPSRTIMSALALLLLAFIWGSSLQTNLLSKPDTGRLVTMQDS